eukprot:comp17188_c0_seq1/m.16078 comp17188_c0_seq1/g.16078  ORF comp17188_c0_seq1/g.16078 comp17188_c0_seq1/m.16078 type:complete len:254 (-) comp17188_c0_seq1:545-1306(-)
MSRKLVPTLFLLSLLILSVAALPLLTNTDHVKRVARHEGEDHSSNSTAPMKNGTNAIINDTTTHVHADGTTHDENHVVATTKCPVCGSAVNISASYYVSVKNGTQKTYTCSEEHGKMVMSSPMKYVLSFTTPMGNGKNSTMDHNMGNTNFTTVMPEMECPFCKMDGVKEHALHFNNGQALYACMMPEHNVKLQNETALTAAFSRLVSTAAESTNQNASGAAPTPTGQTGTKSAGVKISPSLLVTCALVLSWVL